ncbi:hypothetical protein [Kocuria arenosa]|uniref:hypothetical protein n=1 Tax=Kocuria arenosa TaxID=3071446 RepID=UPI0034D39ED7
MVATTNGYLTAAKDLDGFTRLAQLGPEASEAPAAVVEAAPRWGAGSIFDRLPGETPWDQVPTAPGDQLRAQIFTGWNAGDLTRDAYRVALTLLGSKSLAEGCSLAGIASEASTPAADVPNAIDELARAGFLDAIIDLRPALQTLIAQVRGPLGA